MFLKRIEIQGFKSFADKVVINFENSVTGIVGPNGCGKSNIADAIRWVLGEQSVKSLRGEKMVDVIFAGSENRRPLNKAEVTLVLTTASIISMQMKKRSKLPEGSMPVNRMQSILSIAVRYA